jgi:hypothetical protein
MPPATHLLTTYPGSPKSHSGMHIKWSEICKNQQKKTFLFSSFTEDSKDREFVTPFDIQSLNRFRSGPVVDRHSTASLADYSANVATLSESSFLCTQTGETFCWKVASAGTPVDGYQGAWYGQRCPSDREQPRRPGRHGRGCQSLTGGGMRAKKPGCGGC